MSAPTPPADTTSLLVPVHLDAWVVDSTNQELTSWYLADYTQLQNLQSPIPQPFQVSGGERPPTGVYLFWSIPDALTHGVQQAGGSVRFPFVPNRWLITRFAVPQGGAWTWDASWVVQSDYVDPGGTQGTSAFLDPAGITRMTLAGTGPGTQTDVQVATATLGRSQALAAWEAGTDPGGAPFLQAVGPGNVSFAAYAPFVGDVFSFVDSELPPEGTGVYDYTYLVAGWYAVPGSADPLRGVSSWDPQVWPVQADWAALTPAQRFEQIMAALRWSVGGDAGSTPPSTSLYHAVVSGVQWPHGTLGNAGIDPAGVRVVVANTAVDALAALVQSHATEEAGANPGDAQAWLAAGATLAELLQALQYDALDSYGAAGGQAVIDQAVMDAWFGSTPGGTEWQAVSAVPSAAGTDARPARLTAAQQALLNADLAKLNAAQRQLDQATRELQSTQAELYRLWWKVGLGGTFGGWVHQAPITVPPWTDLKQCMLATLYPAVVARAWAQQCAVTQAAAALPPATDPAAANAWANAAWSFPSANGGPDVDLAGLGLELKAGALPRFRHPVDPVVLVAGVARGQTHGEDGRYNADGTLTCRLPGQTVTGIAIPGQPALSVAVLQAHGVVLNPMPAATKVPDVGLLAQEAFFADPANAAAMSTATGITAAAITAAVTALLGGGITTAAWAGTAPAPFSVTAWEQAWLPLYLEWELQYFPTGTGTGASRVFSPADWTFDGEQFAWAGTGFDKDYFSSYSGRALLTPQAPLTFGAKLKAWLASHASADTPEMESLLATVAGWDLLSQSLGGFTDQLVTLGSRETFPPPPCSDPVPCPPVAGGDPPCIAALVGDQYHTVPVLENPQSWTSGFYPVRGGFAQLQKLQVVDAFAQTFNLAFSNTPQGFEPILGEGLTPAAAQAPLVGAVQLPPRVVQDGRLDLRFLANDGSGKDVAVSPDPGAVCGWLLPNHLDGGISVYDSAGTPLGELVSPALGDPWRPRPGPPGATPPPPTPAGIANPALAAVAGSIATQTAAVFGDLLRAIDETLWMVDPLGGRKDTMLSVLIGRPLAVVQAQLTLSLNGTPTTNQTWNAMVDASCTPLNQIGEVLGVPFPVRLGSLELRDDGLLGYWLPSSVGYGTFYTVHVPGSVDPSDTYLKPIVAGSGAGARYQGDVSLQWQGPPVTATLLVDPRGSVHAYTGILPVASASLPAGTVEALMSSLSVTFQTGPVIADPGTLRLPLPAEKGGSWSWVQAVPAPTAWEVDPVVDADDRARLPDGLLQLRDGWLQLTAPGTGDG
jgi:hypothetical protein